MVHTSEHPIQVNAINVNLINRSSTFPRFHRLSNAGRSKLKIPTPTTTPPALMRPTFFIRTYFYLIGTFLATYNLSSYITNQSLEGQ